MSLDPLRIGARLALGPGAVLPLATLTILVGAWHMGLATLTLVLGRSAEAAREIKGLISAGVERVESGAILVQEVGTTMTEIVGGVRRVTDIMCGSVPLPPNRAAASARSTTRSISSTR